MPRRRSGAYRRYRCIYVAARKPRPHPREIDPVGLAEPSEEEVSDRARSPAEDPGGCEIDDVQRSVRAEQDIAMVEVGQCHSTLVKSIQHRAQSVKERVIEPRTGAFPQRLGVDPPGGQSVRAEATEKGGQSLNPHARRIGCRLAPDQPASKSVSNQGAALRIGLHRHAFVAEIVKEHIGLGAVAPINPPNRFEPGETIEVECISAIRV